MYLNPNVSVDLIVQDYTILVTRESLCAGVIVLTFPNPSVRAWYLSYRCRPFFPFNLLQFSI